MAAVILAAWAALLWLRPAPHRRGGRRRGAGHRRRRGGRADLARDDAGTLHAVYYAAGTGGDYDIWYITSDDDGLTWSTPVALTGDAGRDWFPSILCASDGKLWVFWSSDRTGVDEYDIWYTSSSDGGANWSDATRLTEAPLWDYAPSIMQAADGRLWVAYYSYREQDWDIWYQTSSDGGSTWSAATRMTDSSNWEYTPDIIQLASGDIWLTWYAGKLATSAVLGCYSMTTAPRGRGRSP
jgi:hypothetical protein